MIDGCERCQRRMGNRRPEGHECDDLCRLLGEMIQGDEEGHEAWHRTEFCPDCGTSRINDDGTHRTVDRRCKYDKCREWHCPECDSLQGSDGPVSCRCNSTWLTRLLMGWMSIGARIETWFRARLGAHPICQWCAEDRHVHDANSGKCINAASGCECESS